MLSLTWAVRYALITIKHKWFVLVAGLQLEAPLWRLLLHDLSKFRPSELFAYGRKFCGSADDDAGFTRAWLHHQNRNQHHWEYWIPRSDTTAPLRIPRAVLREMVADWIGATRAYNGAWPSIGAWGWYQEMFEGLRMEKASKAEINYIVRQWLRQRTPPVVFSHWLAKITDRAGSNAHQDQCEGAPFSSVGGLNCRNNMKIPRWIPPWWEDEYLAAYCEQSEKMYGADWRDCEFSWSPALVIRPDAEKG